MRPIGGTACKKSILLTPAEQPVKSLGELDDINKNDAKWHEGARIRATVVVQGWTYDGINLWDVGDRCLGRLADVSAQSDDGDRARDVHAGSQQRLADDARSGAAVGSEQRPIRPACDGHNVQTAPGAPPTQAQMIENGATP